MRTHIFLVPAVCAVLFSQAAAADHRSDLGFTTWGANQDDGSYFRKSFYRPNYGGYFGGGRWNQRHRWDRWGNNRGFVSLSHNDFYPPYRSFVDFSGFEGSDGGALIGGLMLGSLINQAIANRSTSKGVYRNPQMRTRTIISTGQSARSRSVISSSRPRSTLINQNGRRLLRDLEGKCYERAENTAGEELRIELDPAECAY